ncbi:MAG TPA: outer membrane beta-barrel protein [Devosia sp.]|nr:outer membrane beta-barrel protein [Devosia sp.]
MRHFGIGAALLLAGLTATPALATDWTGFYMGFYGGASIRNNDNLKGTFVLGTLNEDGGTERPSSFDNVGGIDPAIFSLLNEGVDLFEYVDGGTGIGYTGGLPVGYAPGSTIGAVAGYRLGNGLRVEVDLSSSTFSADGIGLTDGIRQDVSGAPGDTWVWTLQSQSSATTIPLGDLDPGAALGITSSARFLLANAWYDFDNKSAFTPYIGGGLGVAEVTTDLEDGGLPLQSNNGFTPAAQLGTGLRIDLNDDSVLDFGYRLKVAASGGGSVSAVQQISNLDFIGYSLSSGGPLVMQTLQAGLTFHMH